MSPEPVKAITSSLPQRRQVARLPTSSNARPRAGPFPPRYLHRAVRASAGRLRLGEHRIRKQAVGGPFPRDPTPEVERFDVTATPWREAVYGGLERGERRSAGLAVEQDAAGAEPWPSSRRRAACLAPSTSKFAPSACSAVRT